MNIMYVRSALEQAAKYTKEHPDSIEIYWRPRTRYNSKDKKWNITPYPDADDGFFGDVSDTEYIGYSMRYVYVWVVYDYYTGSFQAIPRSPVDLSDLEAYVEAALP